MSRWLKRSAFGLLVAVAAVLVAARAGAFAGTPPSNLGVRDGRLAPPSATPNSVSSQAGLWAGHPRATEAAIAPMPWVAGGAAASIERLRALLAVRGDARIVEARPDYLRVEFTTRWLRFVDDAEFWADPAAGVVQLRSASRLGRSDLGVNRARLEALRAAYTGAGS